jgi:hypothetical protein
MAMAAGKRAHVHTAAIAHPDAALLALASPLRAAMLEENAAIETDAPAEVVEAAYDRAAALVRAVPDMVAQTPEGLRVKCLALQWARGIDDDWQLGGPDTTDWQLLGSIVRDVVAMCEARR